MSTLVWIGTIWRDGCHFLPVLRSFFYAKLEVTFFLIIALTSKFTWGLKSLEAPALVFVSRRATCHLDICTAFLCAVGGDTHVWVRVIYAAIVSELPDDVGKFGSTVSRTMLHPYVCHSILNLSTQLSHGVKPNLLLRRVFEVLVTTLTMAAEQGQVSSCGVVVRGVIVQTFRVDSGTTHRSVPARPVIWHM